MSKTAWIVVIVAGILLVGLTLASWFLPFAFGSRFGFGMMGRGIMGPGMMGGSPFMFMGGIGMLLFWVLIVVGAVWLFRSFPRGTTSTGAAMMPESPLDILKRRYAKGEITKEQFEEMKSTLGTSS